MYNTACPRCHGPIDPGFRFCKTCGCDLAYPYAAPQGYYAPPADTGEKQGMTLLAIALGIKIGNVLLTYLMMMMTHSWEMWSIMNKVFSLIFVICLLVFAIVAKNKRAKLFLFIFFGAEILILLYEFFRMPFGMLF